MRAPRKEHLQAGLAGTRLLPGMPRCGRWTGRGASLSLSCSSLHRTVTVEARGRGSLWRPSRAQGRAESKDGTGNSERDSEEGEGS